MGTVEAIERSIFGRVQEIKARFLSSVCGEETKKSEVGFARIKLFGGFDERSDEKMKWVLLGLQFFSNGFLFKGKG